MFVDVKHVGSTVLYERALESDAKRRLLTGVLFFSSKKILGQTVSKIVSIGHGLEVGRHRLAWRGHVRLQTAPCPGGRLYAGRAVGIGEK